MPVPPSHSRPLPVLTPRQQVVLGHVAAGKSISESARLAGVHRVTVHAWMRDCVQFRAAFNGWQKDVHDSIRARLLAICDDAVGAVHRSILKDDAKSALEVLSRLGMLRPSKPGTSDPSAIYLRDRIAGQKVNAEYNEKMDAALINELMSGVKSKPRTPGPLQDDGTADEAAGELEGEEIAVTRALRAALPPAPARRALPAPVAKTRPRKRAGKRE